ncbi:MAG TPA: NAD(P)-dependent oxidoreductase [Bacteroidia bacterium]|nr:NAD(P)-dependent oxidoreductase [Bacteroidia bacterium]
MSKGTVLIIDDVHPYFTEQLPGMGYAFDYRPEIQRAEILECISNYQGLIVRSKTIVDREMLDRAAKLKFIGRAGSGLEIIDVSYAGEKGVTCFNTPEANRDAVAEQAVGMLLSLLANIHKSYLEVRNWVWDREGNRGYELSSMTVGIVGYGNTGSAFAQKLSGFGCKLLAYDKYKSGYGTALVKECNMDELFEQADILSFHIPLTAETKHMVNTGYLNRFKKNIYLLNLSRGKIIIIADIINALQTGKLRGVALDVLENENFSTYFEEEKSNFYNLLSFPHVLVTSHIGGWTHESYYKISYSLVEKIKQL